MTRNSTEKRHDFLRSWFCANQFKLGSIVLTKIRINCFHFRIYREKISTSPRIFCEKHPFHCYIIYIRSLSLLQEKGSQRKQNHITRISRDIKGLNIQNFCRERKRYQLGFWNLERKKSEGFKICLVQNRDSERERDGRLLFRCERREGGRRRGPAQFHSSQRRR